MKKILVILTVAAIGFAFTSCTKERECLCSGKYSILGLPDFKVEDSIGEMSPADCKAHKYSVNVPGAVVDVKCKPN